MRKFIAGATMSRTHLLKGKASAFQRLIANLLAHRHCRFDTPFGVQCMKQLLAEHGIVNTDESVMAFIESVGGDEIGILCFQTGEDDYEFKLVTGSNDEILRMTKFVEERYDSTNRDTHVSFE